MALTSQVTAPTSVKRQADRVWIDGVPALSWGSNHECTFLGALEAALAPTPYAYKYSQLMGLSGLGFRVRWCRWQGQPQWCPSCAVGEFPEEIKAVEQATGWRFRMEVHLDKPQPHMERFAEDITLSINQGRPVLCYEPRCNMAVIYGYAQGGQTLLLRDYFTGNKGDGTLTLPASQIGPFLMFLAQHDNALPVQASVPQAVQTGVRNWRRERGDGGVPGRDYWYGQAALRAWINDLQQADTMTDEQRQKLFFVNVWSFCTLHDARESAASFLRHQTAVAGRGVGETLRRAALPYQQEANLLSAAKQHKDAFLGQWTGKGFADWTPQVRQREVQMLSAALRLESAAIGEMEKTLAT